MHEEKLTSLDAFWSVESAAMNQVCGVRGAESIKMMWWEASLPCEQHHRDPEEAALAARQFLDGDLCKWSHASCQSEIEVATKMLEGLSANIPPPCAKAKSAWLQRVYAQLSWFIRCRAPKESAGGSAGSASENADVGEKWLYGSQALQSMWRTLEESKPVDSLKLEDLAVYGTFRHLLKSEQCKKLDKWVSMVYERQPKAKAKPAARKKAKPSPAPLQGDDVAMSLLGL